MQEDELPDYLRQKVDALRSKGPTHALAVERLLQRRRRGTVDDRRRVDELLTSLAKPNRWGLWLGVGIGAVAVAAVGSSLAVDHEQAAGVAAGVKTVAKVVRLEDGNCLVGEKGRKCTRLQLEVHPESGDAYPAELTSRIHLHWMSRVQPGSWLTVAVDPRERTKIYFDEASMSVAPPSPR